MSCNLWICINPEIDAREFDVKFQDCGAAMRFDTAESVICMATQVMKMKDLHITMIYFLKYIKNQSLNQFYLLNLYQTTKST